ncbi:MAG: MscL family protein, partial [Patescibacteria group bacterium]
GQVMPTVITPAPGLDVKKKLKETITEFIVFVREQGVVSLAIAFILGGAINKVVTSLVQDVIQPFIGLIFGSTQGLKAWHLGPILLGNFAANVIDFLIIAWVVYVIFKKLKLETLDKKKS